MEDEPILKSATIVAMDIFELFQVVGDEIVYDVYKAIDLIQKGIRGFADSEGAGAARGEGGPFAARGR